MPAGPAERMTPAWAAATLGEADPSAELPMTRALLALLIAGTAWNAIWAALAVASVLALGGRLTRVGVFQVARFTVRGAEVRPGLIP